MQAPQITKRIYTLDSFTMKISFSHQIAPLFGQSSPAIMDFAYGIRLKLHDLWPTINHYQFFKFFIVVSFCITSLLSLLLSLVIRKKTIAYILRDQLSICGNHTNFPEQLLLTISIHYWSCYDLATYKNRIIGWDFFHYDITNKWTMK